MNQNITSKYENETNTHYYRIAVPGRDNADIFIHAANPAEALKLVTRESPDDDVNTTLTADEVTRAVVTRADEPVTPAVGV